ncbi:MAG TPA: hypothetical protein VMT54_13105 [Candidatus Cybelea sp.]|nr:hypothetical protein [Candidatus Cybelea sp.]
MGRDSARDDLRATILAGKDPLGAAFAKIRTPPERRKLGATYTPPVMVDAMLAWAAREAGPIQRVVDPGAGSGRFLMAVARRFPAAELIAVEIDPAAALLLRANLAVLGLTDRVRILIDDYRAIDLPPIEGRTLFIGNPPYVRHHRIAPRWKDWYAAAARRHGVKASRLAGLHLHFFLKTLDLARAGDLGCFVTAAEWLDVNYGATLRRLFAGPLGLKALHRLDPKVLPFADAVTTGVIACFEIGARPKQVRLREIGSAQELGDLSDGIDVPARALTASRWSLIARSAPAIPPGWAELGELCRVHRGQVTGGNAIWIAGPHSAELPDRFLFPVITKARELIAADTALRDTKQLRRVIDLPSDPDLLDEATRAFLDWAKAQGANTTYIARHRKPWWSVGLKPPAPILCTYMARRPPVFVRNLCAARHINIAHGLYPREPMSDAALDAIAGWLNRNVAQAAGRTYAGGLTKFEPKELERIALPPLESLAPISASTAG